MTRIVIQPRDPLIVRDGRPFTADLGARARSLGFPMPSTIIGAIRTLAGSNSSGEFVQTSKPELKALLEDVTLLGPLLVEQNKNDWNILAPSPADALGLEDTSKIVALRKLQPLQISQTMLCDLETGLHPVGLHPADSKAKPTKLPRYWHWNNFEQWLMNKTPPLENLGHDGPTPESRTHVSIDPATQTARNGALYQTSGLEFRRQLNKQPLELGLLLETTAKVTDQLRPLGGERRLMHWQTNAPALPTVPAGLLEALEKHQACRIIFLTPAILGLGYLPKHKDLRWHTLSLCGIDVKIKAVANGRYQTISGWDFANDNPKPTRRIVPAGSVYFVQLTASPECKKTFRECLENWLEKIWMKNHSDEPQDTRDGFGLAAVGIWDGVMPDLEVK